ncbi:MAG: DNA methyltransferase [Chloroflexi bacterium]|nr:DNA methyltransferase [Chloroflexota bacterium]MCY4248699.1 DNA methyltransferase [Chloroflexota bacterium]
MNSLFYGDCLTVMREKMLPESVDLVYLDPPFNSERDYNAIYKDETGRPLPDQVEAFTDTWTMDTEGMKVIDNLPILLSEHRIIGENANFLAMFLKGLSYTQSDMAAYLSYMTERLLWIRHVLKPNGSVYLHCDQTASHYLKVVMDVLFGQKGYRNEIVWRRLLGGKSDAGQYGRSSDRLLFYSMSNDFVFNPPRLSKHNEKTIAQWYKNEDDRGKYVKRPLTAAGGSQGDSGKPWRGKVPTGHWTVPRILQRRFEEQTGRMLKGAVRERLDILADNGYIDFSSSGLPSWRRYLDEAEFPRVHDLWIDDEVKPMGRNARERLGYETQKPVALLERIISSSSNPGEVVFDPFCGCATTIEAANKLGRNWIGIDIAIHAIKRVARRRLQERLHLVVGEDYVLDGIPKNWEGAQELWRQDPYQFQKWAVEQVEGFVTVKRTADEGIDGRIYFDMPGEEILQSMALEVKGGGTVGIAELRSLISVLQYENVQMVGLIVLNEPVTRQVRNFKRTMAQAGTVKVGNIDYAKAQLLTVRDILEEKRFDLPRPAGRSGLSYESDLFSHA